MNPFRIPRLNLALMALMAALSFAGCRTLDQKPEAMRFSQYDGQVAPILAQMTLDEKIGQMIQAEQDALKDLDNIERYHMGSLLSGGNSDPKAGNSAEAWADLYDRCQERALKTRLGIPLLYGVDAVHGHSNVLDAVIFPHNAGLGCTRDPDLIREIARLTALEVRATGIHWTFAPCVTVPQDIRWGRTYEGFSYDPNLVSEMGAAAVEGFQHGGLDNPAAVLACVKHYCGDGGTAYGSGDFDNAPLDQGDTRVDEQTLRDIHIYPYRAAIRAGAGSIMPSYSSWNGAKLSGSHYLLSEVLKDELGFEGFLISDYNAIDQVDPDYKTAIEKTINAGMDMAMVPTRYAEFFKDLKELVEEGRVPISRIDDAVTRILRVKCAMGLLDKDCNPLTSRAMLEDFGSDERRAVARRAVSESLVLLENGNGILPLAKELGRIHVAGSGADNLGRQCGGWTIDWQGGEGEITTGGTTVLTAIRHAVGDKTRVSYSADGTGAGGADVAIAIIGETPYAEGSGDRCGLALDPADIATVRKLRESGAPVVVILFSGRPMILGEVAGLADAIIAAWLPGTEGDGVADVIFGDAKPVGKLSFPWPATMNQVPMKYGDETARPLYPYGYGLTY